MKTPIIQNDAEEPSEPKRRPLHPRGEPADQFAGRMGRWSAHHRKTAIFGWLALRHRLLRARHRRGTTKSKGPPRACGSGRMDETSTRVQAARGESVLIQSDSLTSQGRGLRGCRRRRRRLVAALTRSQRPIAARSENAGQIVRRTRPCSSTTTSGRSRSRGHEDRSGRGLGREAKAAHPELFVGEFGDSADKESRRVHERPQEGRVPLGPGHPGHPDRRLRGPRRRRHPAPARAEGDHRDVRAGRTPELALAHRRGRLRARAPDRARGRRRLPDVLFEARARGTAAGRSEEAALQTAGAPPDARCSSRG